MKYWRKTFSEGYINPADNFPDVTASEKSLIVSILSAGTFFGALLSAPVADGIGRKYAMIFNTIVFTLGVILQTAAVDIPVFVAGRFFAGLGVGLLSATIPLYQSEALPKWIRGTIVGSYQWAITIGILIATIVLNATKNRDDSGSYRIPVAVQFAFSIIIWVGIAMSPETPRYLIKKGDNNGAAKSLSRLRSLPVDHPSLVEELAEIRANHEYEMRVGTSSYLACYRAPILKRQLTGIGLQALQQFTGINFIFYYGTTYFTQAGIQNPFVISMITAIVNVVTTLPGLYLVEKWGRRPLLLFGAVGMTVCQLIVACVGTALPNSQTASKASIAFVCFYISFFACSWGPCAWVVTGEIFPLKARAKGLSMTTASNWLINFALAYATPYLVEPGPGNADLGPKLFFLWTGFCVVCTAFIYFFIYETKGLSLEEVDELYEKVPHAWQSKGFVPTVNFRTIQEYGPEEVRNQSLSVIENAAAKRQASIHAENIAEKH